MNHAKAEQSSRDYFGPRDLLLSALSLHIVAGLFLFPLLVTALVWSLSALYYGGIHNFRFDTLPYPGAALLGVGLFIWSWRRRQLWLPAVAFTLFTIAFWLGIVLPYTRLFQ